MNKALLSTLLLLGTSNAFAMAQNMPVPPAQRVFIDDFEDGVGPWDLKRIVDSHSAGLQKGFARSGNQSVRFELRKDDHVSDGYRSEVRDPYFAPLSFTTWYHFSVYVPRDFPIAKSNSCVFAQWHDQKDSGDMDRNPPIAIRLRGNGKLHITGRHHSKKIQRKGDINPEILFYEDPNFQKGRWNDFLLQVKWSHKESGIVKIWRNQKLIVNYQGPIGYHDDKGPYFKMGVYCRETALTPLVAYHDNYRRAPTFKELKLDFK